MTVRASTPLTVMPLKASGSGHVEMRPRCGLMPTRCVHAAGIRTLPAPSDPIAAVTSPAATAAALPPDEPPGVWSRRPRVSGVSEGGSAGERPLTELARVGLADDDRARGAQPAHDLGVGHRRSHPARRTEHRRCPREVDVVLDRDRHPEQWAVLSGGSSAVGPCGVGECLFTQHHAKRVECRLACLDGVQRLPRQLNRRHAATGQPVQQAGQGGEGGRRRRRCGGEGRCNHQY